MTTSTTTPTLTPEWRAKHVLSTEDIDCEGYVIAPHATLVERIATEITEAEKSAVEKARQEEREAIAQIFDDHANKLQADTMLDTPTATRWGINKFRKFAEAIRARSEQKVEP